MIINRNTDNLYKLTKLSIILLLVPTLFISFFPGRIVGITIVCAYPLIVFLAYIKTKSFRLNFDGITYVRLFQFYYLLVMFRGIIDADTSGDWKNFFSFTVPVFLFVHFSIILTTNALSVAKIFSTFASYGLVICFIIFVIPYSFHFEFPGAISPIQIMILLIPYLGRKYGIFVITLATISFFSDLESRTNILNIIVALLITSTFIIRKYDLVFRSIRALRGALLIAPIVLLILGLTGVFNIFLISETLEIANSSNEEELEEALADSRTGIYTDVFTQLEKDDAILFGLGSSGTTETYLIGSAKDWDLTEIYKEGRRMTESGMLTYIQWGGLVGGLLYFLLFVKGSYYAIMKSNNWFSVMLGLWVVYKGMFSFIEDRISFSIGSLFIFLALGMCLNKNIRQMTDVEIKVMFRYAVRKSVIFAFLSPRSKIITKNKDQ